jgi:hypothetical protein
MKFMKISRDIRGVVTAFDARIASVHNSSSWNKWLLLNWQSYCQCQNIF